ncbi:transcriptional xre family [Seiridium cupressi]
MRKRVREIRKAFKKKETDEDNITRNTIILLYRSINDQGVAELHLKRFTKACNLFSECSEQCKNWGSEDDIPFEYCKFFHNMGIIKKCRGKFREAVSFDAKCVEVQLKHEGRRTMRVKWFEYYYACAVLQCGDHERALELHLRILKEREIISGRGHMKEIIDRAYNAGRGRWPECSLGRACLYFSRVSKARSAAPEDVKKYEKQGIEILDKYRDICPSQVSMGDILGGI